MPRKASRPPPSCCPGCCRPIPPPAHPDLILPYARTFHRSRPILSTGSMRFPLALTVKIARHIIKHKVLRTPRFALVLQLEPLHTCNLTCTGCGRIREYSTSLKDMMSLEDCLASAQECDAPMVSICGGEPLIYPEDRGAGGRAARAGPHRLYLHERHVHAEEAQGLPGRHLFAGAGADARPAAGREADFGQGRRDHPQGQARRPPRHQADASGSTGTSTWTAWNTRTT